MTKPHYFVHVGPHKNGTTYLQHCLAGARNDLLEKGIYYPTEMISPNNKIMHMPLYYAARKNMMMAESKVFADINSRGYSAVVLSCEHFIRLDRESLITLRDAIGDATIDIVYYVRRWSDRLPSLWNQGLRHGEHAPLPAYCMNLLHSGQPSEDFDYSLSWEKLIDVFGSESLRLVPYSTLGDSKTDIFTAFCRDILGLTDIPQPARAGTAVYASPGPEDSEVVRALNSMFMDQHGEMSIVPNGSFLRGQRRSEIVVDPVTDVMGAYQSLLVLDDNDPTFTAAYAKMNTYSDKLVGAYRGQEMFSRSRASAKYIDPGYLLHPGIADAMRELYVRLALHNAEITTKPGRRKPAGRKAPTSTGERSAPAEA